MGFQDKSIQCVECGATFTFSGEEQELFQQRGYTNEPKRCLPCRQARKATRPAGERGPQQRFPAVCAQCGKETEVPFEPKQGRPVYCSTCFSQVRQSRQK